MNVLEVYRILASWSEWPILMALTLLAGSFGYWLLQSRIAIYKERNELLADRLDSLSKFEPDTLLTRLTNRHKLLSEEIVSLEQDAKRNFKTIDEKKKELMLALAVIESYSAATKDLQSAFALTRGHATMLKMIGELNEKQLNYLRKLFQALDLVSSYIHALTLLDKQKPDYTQTVEPTHLRNLIETVIEQFKAGPGDTDRKFVARFQANLPPLLVNAPQIELVIRESIRNSILAAVEGSSIVVSLTETGNDQVIQIINTSPTAFQSPQEILDSGDILSASRNLDIPGYGLAFAARFVKQHKGNMTFDSDGSRTVLSISLPKTKKS